MEPTILTRDHHSVSRKDISSQALKVLYRLQECGYHAYLAGGCVRDLLLGRKPKDFDVVTNATPEEVKRCFRNCRLIGRRFRLAHVCFGPEVIEVATFRSNVTEDRAESEHSVVNEESGIVLRDNVYGSPEEDAFRRDFTVNALFYNIADFSVIDYVGALDDIEARTIRCIGDPQVRYKEDPVRMLRAVRFASTLDLAIEEEAWRAILDQHEQMVLASNARLFEELVKVFNSGASQKAFSLLRESKLLSVMLPRFSQWLEAEATEPEQHWVRQALSQMDKWKEAGVKAAPELQYALLFAPLIRAEAGKLEGEDFNSHQALKEAVFVFQKNLAERVLIPKRVTFHILDLLSNQDRFQVRNPARAERFCKRPFFRDALVFFKFDNLVNQLGEEDLILEWTEDLKALPPAAKSHHRGGRRSGSRRPRHRQRRQHRPAEG